MALRKDQRLWMKNLLTVIYCAVILLVSFYSLKKPAYNWDILPYMGVILSYDDHDAVKVHDRVYAIAKEQIPTAFYDRLTDPDIPYRVATAQNPASFSRQLPFYVVKPLYTWAGYLFYKAGISLPMSTVWPSVIAYFLLGLLLFYWMRKYWSLFFAFTGSLLTMVSAPLLSVAKLSSPDALSGLLLFTAVYFIIERRSLAWTILFLLLSILARLDNIIPAIFFLALMAFSKKWKDGIAIWKYLLLFSGMLLLYFVVSLNAYSFGWSLLYYPNFARQLNPSYNINSSFIFKDYIALAKSQFITGLYYSCISLFLLFILLLFANTQSLSFKSLSIEQLLAIVFLLVMLVRFVLQPLINDRLYIPYYLSVIVFLAKKYSFAVSGQQYHKK